MPRNPAEARGKVSTTSPGGGFHYREIRTYVKKPAENRGKSRGFVAKCASWVKTGDITWVSKSGKTEKRRHVTAGDRLQLRVVPAGDEYELWDGKWSVLMPADAVRVAPCIRVEYDLSFYGGDHSKVGEFAYIPVANIGRSVEAAFEKQTGHKRVHIVHYSEDELYDSEGNPANER